MDHVHRTGAVERHGQAERFIADPDADRDIDGQRPDGRRGSGLDHHRTGGVDLFALDVSTHVIGDDVHANCGAKRDAVTGLAAIADGRTQ